MRKCIFILAALTLALFSHYENAYAFAKGAEQDCIKCHSLNADQARDLLKPLVPDIKILEIKEGPLKGLWEVDMESGGKKGLFYVDYSKKNIISGNILDIKTRANYTKESFDRLNKVDFSQIPLDNALVMGSKDAKYKIVVFDDPE
jgi:thiol:disulfide interchange protein DsbC